MIGPLGDAKPCCFASRMVGNLTHQTLDQVWNGPQMIRLRGAIHYGFVDPVCRNASCTFVRDMETRFGAEAYDFRFRVGSKTITSECGVTSHMLDGWGLAETWGIWTEGKRARLVFDLDRMPASGARLKVFCRSLVDRSVPVQRVDLSVNGAMATRWTFRLSETSDHFRWKSVDISPDQCRDRRIVIDLDIHDPVSPKSFGVDDGRSLGVAVAAIRIEDIRSDRAATIRRNLRSLRSFDWKKALAALKTASEPRNENERAVPQ